MVYGPYDTTYGQGHHTAQFKLMVDNNSGSDVVASLDVVTGFGGNILATRQVRRSDFSAANQWQTFTLQFDNPCFGYFEARVWWAGNTNMKFAQLTITPLEVATSGVQWLVTDQLGTPRMVFDKTGSFNGVSRHDYMPFGEELYVGTGGRTSTEGYNTDNVRQHFTGYEADVETGLNFAQARYQSPVQGRFTSVDPLGRSANVLNPQSFNRYSYVLNNPTNLTDPFGLMTKGDQADPDTGDDGKDEGDDPSDDPQQQAQPPQQPPAAPKPTIVDLREDKTIKAALDKIRAGAKPLPDGTTPELSDVKAIVGDTSNINNGGYIDGYGNEATGFTGTVTPVAYVGLDQGGNIIQGNGVALAESIKTIQGDPPQTTPGLAPTPKGGVYIDVQSANAGSAKSVLEQNVYVGQFSSTPKTPARHLFKVGVNNITKDSKAGTISITLGLPATKLR
jgi:RHS repeat-associated protein